MQTEAILTRMERQAKQRQRRKWRRFRWHLLRAILRGSVCLVGSMAIVIVGVPTMELMMDNWGSRLWIEIVVCYFGILWLVTKVYGTEEDE